MRLKDRVCMITGAGAGIGKAIAIRFAEEGALVCICDIDEAGGQAVAKEVGGSFTRINVADRTEAQRWAEGVHAEYGQIDVLINNAGVLRDGLLVKVKDGALVKQMPEDEFDLVLNVNLKGTFNCTQAVAPFMIAQKRGAIINATSIVGLDGNFGQTNYVASKAGVIGMTKVWARELGRHQIRVNAIAPGFTLTEMVQQMPEAALENMVAHTPLGRMGKPEDIANAYVFLASDEASFITGVTLRVDGGIVVGT